ncbi:MAG TPA: uroporphyrinogen-III synthase [Longimicrobiales bacterium]|nr:uroporphyrinogen-III synthase [Longimicrobiales bacterium]
MSALDGRRIAVTRAVQQASGLCAALEARGAVALRCPTIRLAPPATHEELDAALSRLTRYDWIVFTSPNGVRFALDRMEEIGVGIRALARSAVAAVGSRTARALSERGLEPRLAGGGEGASALVASLAPIRRRNVLIARSDRGDPAVVDILRRRGAGRVDDVVAYRTLPEAPAGDALAELRRGVEALTFTSPSTVTGFLAVGPEWRELAEGAIVACLGPTTAGAARRAGLEVHAEAGERTMPGLVAALEEAFMRRPGWDGAAGTPTGTGNE